MTLKKRFMLLIFSLIAFILILTVINVSATIVMRRSFNKVAYGITPKIITISAIESSAGRVREETLSYILSQLGNENQNEDSLKKEQIEISGAITLLKKKTGEFRENNINNGKIRHSEDLPEAASSLIYTVEKIIRNPVNYTSKTDLNILGRTLEHEEKKFLTALKKAYITENRILNQRKKESEDTLFYSIIANIIIILMLGSISVITGIRLAIYILSPLKKLQSAMTSVGRGDLTNNLTIKTGDELEELTKEFNNMVHQLKNAKNELEVSVKEKEILLKEIHHRVKNNLQIVASLLNLQSAEINDKNTIDNLMQIQNRVKAMALVHESLYLSDNLSAINMRDYIHRLVNYLGKSIITINHRIHLELEEVFLDISKAIPCGLIINELLINALKYAFPEEKKGNIFIKISKDDMISIEVKDDGIGVHQGDGTRSDESLGLKLVRALSKQLNGNITSSSDPGMHYILRFSGNE